MKRKGQEEKRCVPRAVTANPDSSPSPSFASRSHRPPHPPSLPPNSLSQGGMTHPKRGKKKIGEQKGGVAANVRVRFCFCALLLCHPSRGAVALHTSSTSDARGSLAGLQRTQTSGSRSAELLSKCKVGLTTVNNFKFWNLSSVTLPRP